MLSRILPSLTVDVFVLASYEIAQPTPRAGMAVAAMPSAAYTIPELPPRLRGRDCDDLAYNLMAWYPRVLHGVHSMRNLFVAVRRTAISSAIGEHDKAVQPTCHIHRTQ